MSIEDFFKCFQISCQGASCITTFADFLCSKIAPALRHAIYEKTALDIARDVKDKIPDFRGNRSTLEYYMLKYLAEEEKFEKFTFYLKAPRLFLNNHIKKKVETYCLDKNRRLEMFLRDSLSRYSENIQSAVFASTTVVKDRKDRKDQISLWLDEFCRVLGDVLSLPRSDLKGIEHQEITDVEFLNNAMTKALSPVMYDLRKEFEEARMSSFERQPHTIVAEQFAGCQEQCPFCGAVCTNTMPNHDGDHRVIFHRPQVLRGLIWYEIRGSKCHKTDNLITDICSSLVSSDCTFVVAEDTWIPYKKYRDAGHPYSTWSIPPDPSMQAYWKWFVSSFRTQLEQCYNGKFHGRGEIPASWHTVTKQNALAELEKC
uniref:Interferon-induced very large GTPase 1 n=1 Tax=Anas zonorhyncha TaxID=75864 RepID=A0A8B9UHR8_9AVES